MGKWLWLQCENCRKRFQRERSQQAHRIRRGCKEVFCSMQCRGKSRRTSEASRVLRKKLYDERYRAKNRILLIEKKAAYHRRTYDKDEARKLRKKRMAWHVEYCRRYYSDPKRKADKVRYDLEYRASKYGPYAEAYKAMVRLNKELLKLAPDKYERLKARGYYEHGGRGWQRRELTRSRRTGRKV
jgi:hypothetical protein